MKTFSVDQVLELQKNPDRIRNMCILAHVDHGKTTLADCFVASNGLISTKMAGKLRYMDSRKDEQERGITMKSSSITLIHEYEDNNYLINMIDSPGHVDFSSEVSTAVRLCDGTIILVDVVEGVCPQTQVVLKQAWEENIKPIIVLNKIDRLILELGLTPLDAYVKITQVLEQVNACMGELFTTDVLAKNDKSQQQTTSTDVEDMLSNWSIGLEDIEDDHLYFSPEHGNVVFASAYDGWAFQLEDFAKLYSSKLGINEKVLRKTLWGDYYLNLKAKRIQKGAQSKAKKPLFVQFILENIWSLYDVIMIRKDKEKLNKITEGLGIKLTARDLRHTDSRIQLQAVCSQWLCLSQRVLDMVCCKLPPPTELTEEKIQKLLRIDFSKSHLDTQKLKQTFLQCDQSSGSPTITFISKMFPVDKKSLPENKPKPLTVEELGKRREVARLQHAAGVTNVKTEESSEEQETTTVEDNVGDCFIAFTRVFSGTVKLGQELYVLGPKHDPNVLLNKNSEEVQVANSLSELKAGNYITRVTITRLYLLMGRELLPLTEAPAGCVIGIGGLEDHVLKTATLSSTIACPAFAELTQHAVPILRVAVEPKHPQDMASLTRGLRWLNLADPAVQVIVQESGEHVIITAGQVHLERCLDDLRERYAQIEINVSEPIVPFRETIITPPVLDMVNETVDEHNTVTTGESLSNVVAMKTANKLCTITLRAVPLPDKVIHILDKNVDLLKDYDRLQSAKQNDDNSKIEEQIKSVKDELEEAFKESGEAWTGCVDKIWCFGPRRCGPNILFNFIPNQTNNVWRKLHDSLSEYENSFCNGFQIATLAGPLCEEPMMGVGIVVDNWEMFDESSVQSGGYGPLSGQIMSAVKEGCRKAFQAQPQRLMSAMYTCSIQVNTEMLGKMYAVLGRRHGRVLSGDMQQGSASFTVKAVLPVVESFNFAEEIRKQTSGMANPQLMFSHWEVIDIDPFWVPRTEEEYLLYGEKADSENRARKYMNMLRRRKGLHVEDKIVEFAEKQRTLSKKK